LVWIKARSAARWHILCDTIRGVNKTLYSNSTYQEESLSNLFNAFNSDGFQVAYNSAYTDVFSNLNGQTYAAWCWDAGSSTVTNTQGSITSQVRANASAGFSIVTYTGTGANATVGHGCGTAPGLILLKDRTSGAYNWQVYHSTFAGTSNSIVLNSTAGVDSGSAGVWNSTAPTSTVFSIGTSVGVNTNGNNYVAYCFAPVTGYSSFGSYTGNGSADGPFVYTGFRPRWIMVKCSSTNNGYTFWDINDAARSDYNSLSRTLCANLSDAEDSANIGTPNIDILSNGFKIRTTGSAKNLSSQTYIYAAFAENPFQYARAR
jgi:hypothetical protein